ncbi:MAG: hypothetical protein Q7U97_12160 [Rhodocyclaceae bacterium]|nr:hypothetical protein [Rhodocyclaceae bacterium]
MSDQHAAIRRRIREIIRERNRMPAEHDAEGGFLPLLAPLLGALAGPIMGKLFGNGLPEKAAKPKRKPTEHNLLVKKIMLERPGTSLADASKLAAKIRRGE